MWGLPVHQELEPGRWRYLDGHLQGTTRHIAFNPWEECQYTVEYRPWPLYSVLHRYIPMQLEYVKLVKERPLTLTDWLPRRDAAKMIGAFLFLSRVHSQKLPFGLKGKKVLHSSDLTGAATCYSSCSKCYGLCITSILTDEYHLEHAKIGTEYSVQQMERVCGELSTPLRHAMENEL